MRTSQLVVTMAARHEVECIPVCDEFPGVTDSKRYVIAAGVDGYGDSTTDRARQRSISLDQARQRPLLTRSSHNQKREA